MNLGFDHWLSCFSVQCLLFTFLIQKSISYESTHIFVSILHLFFRWRIVIHGAFDGFSGQVTFLEASDNNRSNTVMGTIVRAVDQYGVPSRIRCDRGGENNAVCLFMEFGAVEQPAQPETNVLHLPQVQAFNWPYRVEVGCFILSN